ncbi:helix-turn-helix domain-containing protein [Brevibacillus ginsengisoli]|uniref:helix-turn-helix domain-containing protein n=1 Tax=Brevibacillus ginsengisoli TaxID=363854 RepID=UPI003CFB9661
MILPAEDEFFLHAFVIKGLIPLENERTVMSLYYVLKGRKSNQTEQDTHMYGLCSYYRFFSALSKEKWEEILQQLVNNQMIQIVEHSSNQEKETFRVTSKGKALVEEAEAKYSFSQWFPSITATAPVKESELFWKRLHLMTQTISQLLQRNTAFFPVVTDKLVQNWVKQKLRDHSARERWLSTFALELYQLLIPYPTHLQRLLMDQLSGIGQVGHTLEQLAQSEQLPVFLVRLKFRYLLINLMTTLLESEETKYPLMKQLLNTTLAQPFGLSTSAAATYHYLLQTQDIDQIAKRRGLRKGTIEDHLVEIVLHCPAWDHSQFLTQSAKIEIITASQELGTKRLKLLREHLANRYTYLQIRLALAQVKENA